MSKKLDDLVDQNFDTILSKGQILIWLTETIDGDVEQLNLPSGEDCFGVKFKVFKLVPANIALGFQDAINARNQAYGLKSL
ncbi:hypothetical protein KHA80_01215 [Anaerobacillus sp. HL2]|nr:hypothetical protein KHA80_01215 [Anaerobacillus sp. HL2]